VKFTTNFSQLSSVRVITNGMKKELDALLKAEQGIDTAANVQTRPEIKPEIVDDIPAAKPDKAKDKDASKEKPVQPSMPVQPAQPIQPVEPETSTEPQP
jgi:hypothetical protein